MKIQLLNSADIEGGAARAALRLLEGLRHQGVEGRLLVQRKFGDLPEVSGPEGALGKALGFARPTLEQALLGVSPARINGPFAPAFLPDRLAGKVAACRPDIVHLHWVAIMMRLETLRRFRVPLVWTLHDSWPFTGGCFIPLDCGRYRESCGSCPVLGSSRDGDLSRRVWRRKRDSWRGLDLTLVAPSRWMAACARASSLFREARIEVIPNAIDPGRYRPIARETARDLLSLPRDRKLILFGAKSATRDRNKGFHLLARALGTLAGQLPGESAELVLFGASRPEKPEDLGFRTHYLGAQHDDISLALLYSAADLFVLPSLQENLPYTVMEALACGTPCVAFDQGGVADLIEHRRNGYLARAFDPADLARGIAWVLESPERAGELSVQARLKVEREFGAELVARRHIELYRDILRPPQAP